MTRKEKIKAAKERVTKLKPNTDDWEENNDCFIQFQKLDIAKTKLELNYKNRQEQIDLLTESLAYSSRIDRWISSIKAVINQFIDIKN